MAEDAEKKARPPPLIIDDSTQRSSSRRTSTVSNQSSSQYKVSQPQDLLPSADERADDYDDLVRDLFEPEHVSVLEQVMKLPPSENVTERLYRNTREHDPATRERNFIGNIPRRDRCIPDYNPILDKNCKLAEKPIFKQRLLHHFDLSSGFEKILDHRIRSRQTGDIIGNSSVYLARARASGTGPVTTGERRRWARKQQKVQPLERAQGLAHSPRTGNPHQPVPPITPNAKGTSPRHGGGKKKAVPVFHRFVHSDCADAEPVDWYDKSDDLFASPACTNLEDIYTSPLDPDFLDLNFSRACDEIEDAWDLLGFPESVRTKFRREVLTECTVPHYAMIQAELVSIAEFKKETRMILLHVSQRESLVTLYSLGDEEGVDGIPQFHSEEEKSLWREQADQLNLCTARVLMALAKWMKLYPWNHSFIYKDGDIQTGMDESIPEHLLDYGALHCNLVVTGTADTVQNTADGVGLAKRNAMRRATDRRRVLKREEHQHSTQKDSVRAPLPPHLAHVRPQVTDLLLYRQLYKDLEALARLREDVLYEIVSFTVMNVEPSSPTKRIQTRVNLAMDLTREAIQKLKRLEGFDNHLIFLYQGVKYTSKLIKDTHTLLQAGLISRALAQAVIDSANRREKTTNERTAAQLSVQLGMTPLDTGSRAPSRASARSRRSSVGSRRQSIQTTVGATAVGPSTTPLASPRGPPPMMSIPEDAAVADSGSGSDVGNPSTPRGGYDPLAQSAPSHIENRRASVASSTGASERRRGSMSVPRSDSALAAASARRLTQTSVDGAPASPRPTGDGKGKRRKGRSKGNGSTSTKSPGGTRRDKEKGKSPKSPQGIAVFTNPSCHTVETGEDPAQPVGPAAVPRHLTNGQFNRRKRGGSQSGANARSGPNPATSQDAHDTSIEQASRTAQIIFADLHRKAFVFKNHSTKQVTGVDHVPLNAVYTNVRPKEPTRSIGRLRIDEHGHRMYPELGVTLGQVHTHLQVDYGKV